MKALIIADGDPISAARQNELAAKTDFIYVIDGAARRVTPDLPVTVLCGDFDGITAQEAKDRFPDAALVELPDQYCSDLEKTINLAVQDGASQVTIAGALGSRVDHSLVALSLISRIHRELPVTLSSEEADAYFVSPGCPRNGELVQHCPRDLLVSLVSWEEVSMVTISGVKWPLHQTALPAGSGGVSNRATGGEVAVKVHSGMIVATFSVR